MMERLLHRFGHHYILVMMILTRVFGTVGGMLVIYYTELTLDLPENIRVHFRLSAAVVVLFATSLAIVLALWETRRLREVLGLLHHGEPVDRTLGAQAGREAVIFLGRHHRLEAWVVPLTTLVPVLAYLYFFHDASPRVVGNITIAVFMGIAMALMSTFFVVEHCMQPVIRHLLAKGVQIDYSTLPLGKMRYRFRLCFTLIIITSSLMIGTLARQRAADILASPDRESASVAVANLKRHSFYITIAAVITGMVFSTVLAGSVAGRVGKLVDAMDGVAKGDLAKRVRPTGNDEIDVLARHFNTMVHELECNDCTIRELNTNLEGKVRERTQQLEATLQELRDTQGQLTDVAHRAGMAEIAIGVLHNVGNVLNSINVSTSVMHDSLRRSKTADLERLAARLSEQEDGFFESKAQTAKLTRYLEKLGGTIGQERSELSRELESLSEKISHIRGIISAQQNYARKVAFEEHVDLARLVHDTLAMHQLSVKRHGVEVVCDLEQMPAAQFEKSKLVQVIDNLIKNAIEAMSESPERVLTVRGEVVEESTIRLTVSDTGYGISPENQPSLFSYGFTTKQTGNGFGLHWSACAVKELGGEIRAESDGVDRGSSFIVELPLHAETASSDAPAEEPEAALA